MFMKRLIFYFLFTAAALLEMATAARTQEPTGMINPYGRKPMLLNGDWNVVIDPLEGGDWRQVWKERQPEKKTDFVEYSFKDGPTLHVPGDFNTQMPELTYLEGTVWYQKNFSYSKLAGRRLFVHFGAVNYLADVYLNGNKLGSHEGGFTPFQFEVTDLLHEGTNSLVVRVNNQRVQTGLPSLGYDWFNYGGITRDVQLIETGDSYIDDYFLQLAKHSPNKVEGWVHITGHNKSQNIDVIIPELRLDYRTSANGDGWAPVAFAARLQLWSPTSPKRYHVIIKSEDDSVSDNIGFRTIEAQGNKIMLNGKPIFLKGVNIHEERPFDSGRAYSEADAVTLLSWAKELGCNFVRLAHYPHSDQMVETAEKMGLMIWDEIPVYQNIAFADPAVPPKMDLMMKEMVRRDRNRCAVVIWSLSNETSASNPGRTQALITLSQSCRQQDSTRLITSVLSNQGYQQNTFNVWDTVSRYFDVLAVNEYLGWYVPWQGNPADTKWKFVAEKPLIISEFGGEAKYGNTAGARDEANNWNEYYQQQIYKDQLAMFRHTPNLAGVCAWLLVDYRSPVRMQPKYQKGYNRKGLLSEFGERKLAWYVLQDFYKTFNPFANTRH